MDITYGNFKVKLIRIWIDKNSRETWHPTQIPSKYYEKHYFLVAILLWDPSTINHKNLEGKFARIAPPPLPPMNGLCLFFAQRLSIETEHEMNEMNEINWKCQPNWNENEPKLDKHQSRGSWYQFPSNISNFIGRNCRNSNESINQLDAESAPAPNDGGFLFYSV